MAARVVINQLASTITNPSRLVLYSESYNRRSRTIISLASLDRRDGLQPLSGAADNPNRKPDRGRTDDGYSLSHAFPGRR